MDLCENSLLQDKFKNIFCEMSFFTDHNREAGLIWENLIFFQNQTKNKLHQSFIIASKSELCGKFHCQVLKVTD